MAFPWISQPCSDTEIFGTSKPTCGKPTICRLCGKLGGCGFSLGFPRFRTSPFPPGSGCDISCGWSAPLGIVPGETAQKETSSDRCHRMLLCFNMGAMVMYGEYRWYMVDAWLIHGWHKSYWLINTNQYDTIGERKWKFMEFSITLYPYWKQHPFSWLHSNTKFPERFEERFQVALTTSKGGWWQNCINLLFLASSSWYLAEKWSACSLDHGIF